ncbi:MAG: DUF1501 domain-containing protein [Verrucomicrobiales bacterium]|nr:DUF1501 domain-containing protein [Verrucomicrobiales bacterium]MDA7643990.1 DUF1501 domain-containing protein [Verrucomicrobiales bacterium]
MSSSSTNVSSQDCGSPDHTMHRRRFLQGAVASGAISTMSWSGLFSVPAFAEQVKRSNKRCILLWLCGGPSQFETWDPKPGTSTGGPFGSIPTAIPGVHVSELMPKCASILDKMAVIRSMKTNQREHTQAINLLNRGDNPRPPFIRPTLGSVLAQQLGHLDSAIPNFILLDPCPEGNEFKGFKAGNWAGWLGAEYAPVRVGGEFKIEDVMRLPGLSEADHEEREALRRFFSKKFENERKSAAASSHNAVYERVKGLMSCAHLFDLERLPQKDRERYGAGAFGQHALLARSLVEEGAPFVMVANGMPWDTHVFNHEVYQMVVPDMDNIVYQLVNDLEDRGMADDTLVVVMGEFGRTPWINVKRGRDHYPNAWSLAMAGCGIQPGAVVGATDPLGVDVTESPFSEKNLFATIYQALGIDPYAEYDLPNLPTFHRVEERAEPIKEVLA